MPDLVNVTIDDIKVMVPAGTLVVDAAKTAGIEIPVFCSHPKLDPLGACRMCLVEFPGPRGSKLDTACTVRVSEGMVVRTDTEQVKAVREANLGFILINHPLDCPICDKGGECPLQDQTVEYGPGVSKFVEPKRHKNKHYPISDLIVLDQERCILCWRCIRYLEEWEDKPQLGLFERGGETMIDVFPDQPVDAKTSGSIVDICPVGALTSRVSRFNYRPWELTKTDSICTLCPVGCNLRLDERSHTLRRIVARENMAVNDEWICDKGRFLHQYVDHPQRLRTPLVRDGKGAALREATWDEALGRVAASLDELATMQGAGAVGGVASGRVSNEAAYLFQKFFRALVGTNNVDFPDGSAVKAQPSGLSAITDIAKSDVIVLVGIDPSEAAPVLALHIKRAVRRSGAKVVIINPRRIELARYAPAKGAYLPVLPGNEAVVLSELAVAIQASKTAPRTGESTNQRTPRGAGQAAAAQPANVRQGAPATQAGMPPVVRNAQYLPAVDILAAAKSPLFIYGSETARGERGRAAVTALSNLALLLGFGDRLAYIGAEANSQGARDMGLLPDMLPGHLPVNDAAVRERLGKLWGVQPPVEAGLSYEQMISGGVKALYVMGADPAVMADRAGALTGLKFLVVQDMFLTATAQLADVVLPACSFAEADGSYTNLERRVQRAPRGIRPQGDSKADWAILAALAEKWAAGQAPEGTEAAKAAPDQPYWKRKKRAKAKTGPVARPWNYPTASAVLEEVTKAAPAYNNIRWETLGKAGVQWPSAALSRAARRVEPVDVTALGAAEKGSYRLVSGPVLWDGGMLMQQGAEPIRHLIPAPFLALNPADLAAGGLVEGSQVTVTSARGAVVVALKADPAVQPGTAWMPYCLPGSPAETLGAGSGEITVAVR